MRLATTALILAIAPYTLARQSCEVYHETSCTGDQSHIDACCVPSPGRLELSQRWDSSRKKWIVDAVRVMSCDGQTEYTDCDPSRVYSPSKILNLVEGHGRHVVPLVESSRLLGWAGIAPNASDDEVATVWAQQWARHGTCISTFRPECFENNLPPGEEGAWDDPGPALFVKAMHRQQESVLKKPEPLPQEPRLLSHKISTSGSPFLGTLKSRVHVITGEDGEKRSRKVQKLSFFASRDGERDAHKAKHFGGIDHEEL